MSTSRYDAYQEMLDQEIRRRVIERHIARCERKYPERVSKSAALPATGPLSVPHLDIDHIDAHIARATARHTDTVASTWGQGPAHGSGQGIIVHPQMILLSHSLVNLYICVPICLLMTDFIGQDNRHTTVSVRHWNIHGVIGTPLPSSK